MREEEVNAFNIVLDYLLQIECMGMIYGHNTKEVEKCAEILKKIKEENMEVER